MKYLSKSIHRDFESKSKYRSLCSHELSIPLFSQAWWLDAVAGADRWDVALVEEGGQVVASMPYVAQQRLGFVLLMHPPLTQTLGPWFRPIDANYAQRLRRQKDLLEGLIERLPVYDHFIENWHYSQTNWLPFYWKGFRQTTKDTYRLNDLTDEVLLWNQLQGNIRSDIKKARNRFRLRVRTDLDVVDFMTLNLQVFERQGKRCPYTLERVKSIDEACTSKNARKIFIAEDELGQPHAGVYIVWDSNSAYYLLGGSDPNLRNSGATSLCMWEAIQFASKVTQSFDFEGSMIEGVERYFRAFGAEQTPYFAISKTPSRILRTAFFVKDLLHTG